MNVWMDVMRGIEPVIQDYERLFDAWGEGGVDGIVIGPMTFEERVATFDPDPGVYRKLGFDPPQPPAQQLTEKRALLERALRSAKDRGWKVWIFQPGVGAPQAPDARGNVILDRRTCEVWCARMIDTLKHYDMADGAIMDGPE